LVNKETARPGPPMTAHWGIEDPAAVGVTLPLSMFGPENYAYRLGLIGAPSRIAQAVAPLALRLLLEPMGRGVVVVSAGLSLSARHGQSADPRGWRGRHHTWHMVRSCPT
jgi:hypothetical protein